MALASRSFCASCTVIDVGFSKSIPISAEDQRQCEQRRINGPVLSSPVAVTDNAAVHIGQEKQLRVHLS